VVRYATLLSDDPDLFANVRNALRADSRFIDAGNALLCAGCVVPMTNIYPIENSPADWEGWSTTSPIKNPQSMSALLVECRSPEWIAEVGRLIARSTVEQVWIVDAQDVVWPADKVDPERLALT
jgi:hypothetical protein